jgi:hypothetical protein
VAAAISRPVSSDGTLLGSHNVRIYRMPAARSAGIVGFYLFLVLLLLYVDYRGGGYSFAVWFFPLLIFLILLYLVRYASTRYSMDDRRLYAWRIFGSRSMPLDHIRKIQAANLRRMGAAGFLGTWGWRGRVWSPEVGTYEAIHTESEGLLITGEGVPVFISPRDPEAFARELSRRVRSVSGGFDPDETPVR